MKQAVLFIAMVVLLSQIPSCEVDEPEFEWVRKYPDRGTRCTAG